MQSARGRRNVRPGRIRSRPWRGGGSRGQRLPCSQRRSGALKFSVPFPSFLSCHFELTEDKNGTKNRPLHKTEDERKTLPRYHLSLPPPYGKRPHWAQLPCPIAITGEPDAAYWIRRSLGAQLSKCIPQMSACCLAPSGSSLKASVCVLLFDHSLYVFLV